MDLKSEVGSVGNALKSSLDPSTTNVVEIPEDLPEESSADYEADPADPDTIDPELIDAPGLDPEDDDLAAEDLDADLDSEISDPVEPDVDLPAPDNETREEIDLDNHDRSSISHPDAGI